MPPAEQISQRSPRDEPHYDAAAPAESLARNTSAGTLARSSTALVGDVWSIDPADLEFGRVLGQGAFGVVSRGKWRGRDVAVKQIKKSAIGNEQAVRDFEVEIRRMAALQPHENVVQLYGVVQLENGDIGAVFEFCAQGALADALYGDKAREWSDEQLLDVAYDAACGIEHLHANNVVHRDIAARNVLLAGKRDLVAKVGDMGMARELDGTLSEQATQTVIGPLRWMSPEQLTRLAYSKASDVFAFGVLLYEIFAREAPWPGVANVNVLSKVLAGERMTPPAAAPTRVRRLMLACWSAEASERPSMQHIARQLGKEKEN